MKDFSTYIKRIDEGIDFNIKNLTVSFNPSHEENVDTSIENNPSVDNELINNVEVWSIFKRKRGNYSDGNPLIYALKNEKGWKFKTKQDKINIENQFKLIVDKFIKQHPIDVTIIVPSGSSLNKYISDIVLEKAKNVILLDGAICKLTTEEVNDIVLNKDSYFRKIYNDDFEEAYKQLTIYFEEMDKNRNGIFSRHFIKDSKMRDALSNTLKITKDRYAKDSKIINGQNVLLIDDTISRGQTIKEACKILTESYFPKSITVLTLLSKLY